MTISREQLRETLRFVVLRPHAKTPAYHSEGASGFDLSACLDSFVDLEPSQPLRIPTGVAMEIPRGFEGQIRPRSGLASSRGVTVVNAPGTIDADYRGEIFVALINLGREVYRIEPGDRVAQMVICPVARVELVQVVELGATQRSERGFGSTGR